MFFSFVPRFPSVYFFQEMKQEWKWERRTTAAWRKPGQSRPIYDCNCPSLAGMILSLWEVFLLGSRAAYQTKCDKYAQLLRRLFHGNFSNFYVNLYNELGRAEKQILHGRNEKLWIPKSMQEHNWHQAWKNRE